MTGRVAATPPVGLLAACRGVAGAVVRSGQERCARPEEVARTWGMSTRGGRRPMTVQRAAGFRNGIDVRLRLRNQARTADVAFDGAWWPRSHDLGAELPELI